MCVSVYVHGYVCCPAANVWSHQSCIKYITDSPPEERRTLSYDIWLSSTSSATTRIVSPTPAYSSSAKVGAVTCSF